MVLARKVESCVGYRSAGEEPTQLTLKWLGLLCTNLNKKIKKMKQERTTLQMEKEPHLLNCLSRSFKGIC